MVSTTMGSGQMLTLKEAANYVGVSVSTFHRFFHLKRGKNKLSHYKFSNGPKPRYYFKQQDLDSWIENHKTT